MEIGADILEISIWGYKIYVKKSTMAVTLLLIVIALSVLIEIINNDESIVIKENNVQNIVSQTPFPTPIVSSQPGEDLKIYITGSVRSPGIVSVKKGQIIEDAVNLAGGLTEEADVNSINMVYKLKENVMIYVKSKSEQQKQKDQSVEESWSQSDSAGPGIKITADSAGSILGGTQAAAGTQKCVNLNTATEADLDTLPGIGKGTADAIIEYRNKNGPFKNIKDIMKVPGIKESRFNSLKDLITVD